MEQNIKVFYWDDKENIILFKLWKKVQIFLEKKGYKFTMYSEKNEPIWSDLIEEINKGKYDIAIAPLFYMTQRMKKHVDFTYPITTQKTNILYNAKINTENRLLFFLKSSLPVILLMITISIIISFVMNLLYKNNNIYSYISGFLGQSGGILNITNLKKKSNIILNCLIIILIYFLTILLYSLVVGKTVFYRNYKPFYDNIEGKKIVINSGYSHKVEQLKKLGAIPIMYDKKENYSSFDYYIQNMDKYDGIYYIGLDLLNANFSEKDNTFNFKINGKKIKLRKAKINLGSEYIGFVLNKKKYKFVSDIHENFQKIVIKNIFNICKTVKNGEILQCNKEFNPIYNVF